METQVIENQGALPFAAAAAADPEKPEKEKSETAEGAAEKPRRWWRVWRRDRPSRWHRQEEMLRGMKEEQQRLVEGLTILNERISGVQQGQERAASTALDPMPVMKGLQELGRGQREVSTAIQAVNAQLKKAEATDMRLAQSVGQMDQTLSGVQGAQQETGRVLSRVGEKVDESTRRSEELFLRMKELELERAAEFRRLHKRTMIAMAAIAGAVIVTLGIFIAAPWA